MPSLKSCFALAFGCLVLTGAVVQAAPIDPNVAVTGGVTYDTAAHDVFQANLSGTLTRTVGGTTGTTNYSDNGSGLVIGTNPLNGTLTDTGDGFGATGAAGATGDSTGDDHEFETGIDIVMQITNNHGTDVFQVTITTAYAHTVDSSGTDAYVDSEFTLDSRLLPAAPPGTEEFFTHLVTDTVNGNEVGGSPVAGLGGPLADSGTDVLVLTLNPGDTYIVEGDWSLAGGAFADATSFAGLEEFQATLTITDVRNISTFIPEPGTLALLGLGLVGLGGAVIRKRRKKTV